MPRSARGEGQQGRAALQAGLARPSPLTRPRITPRDKDPVQRNGVCLAKLRDPRGADLDCALRGSRECPLETPTPARRVTVSVSMINYPRICFCCFQVSRDAKLRVMPTYQAPPSAPDARWVCFNLNLNRCPLLGKSSSHKEKTRILDFLKSKLQINFRFVI